ncbi:MAG: galactokinase family protein [Propionibacteriaceae bacterium]|nr:galactokinase family protein [Propionibacteriaceae bacterium]
MIRWFVPGRLEVFGTHTDYAGGNSLLAAVDRGITVELEDAAEGISATTTAAPGEELTLIPGEPNDLPAGHWGGYLQAVLDRLRLNFGELKPARITVDSTLPLASGMSSSSALVVALALALVDHNGFREREEWQANIHSQVDLAGYMACFENGMSFGTLAGEKGVGTFGGSEDHTAMLCCRADALTRFRFCPIREGETVPFPMRWTFVVGVSGVLAEKTGAALESYNRASLLTREIVEAWNDATGDEAVTIGDVLAGDEDAWEGIHAVVAHDEELTARLRAFLTESEELIPAAVAALSEGDLDRFGELAERSQHNAEVNLGNQIPETMRMQRLARELGAKAAASFGAGFGGSVWALVPVEEADVFATTWLERYVAEFPKLKDRASTLVTRPGAPARRL